MNPYTLSLVGLAICSLVMTVCWIWAQSRSFFSIVDAIWAFGIGALGAFYFFVQGRWTIAKAVCLALGLAWSVRLGSHLTRRLRRHFPKEDARYEELRSQWGDHLAVKSFIFFLLQAVTQCFFAYPFAVLATSTSSPLLWLFRLGALLSLTGLLGEAIADKQLKSYIANSTNRGTVCNQGLWRYSRHPNYFFEWIVWCGFGAMGAATSGGWPSIACPCVMLGLLLFVTGVPPAEASSLRSKAKLYRDYQARTSRFVPWFPKSSHHSSKEAA